MFECEKFDYIEFWCGDVMNVVVRFGVGLGMGLRCKSDAITGNGTYASYAMKLNDLMFVFIVLYGVESGGS